MPPLHHTAPATSVRSLSTGVSMPHKGRGSLSICLACPAMPEKCKHSAGQRLQADVHVAGNRGFMADEACASPMTSPALAGSARPGQSPRRVQQPRTKGGQSAAKGVAGAEDAGRVPAARELLHGSCQVHGRVGGVDHHRKLLQEACTTVPSAHISTTGTFARNGRGRAKCG